MRLLLARALAVLTGILIAALSVLFAVLQNV